MHFQQEKSSNVLYDFLILVMDYPGTGMSYQSPISNDLVKKCSLALYHKALEFKEQYKSDYQPLGNTIITVYCLSIGLTVFSLCLQQLTKEETLPNFILSLDSPLSLRKVVLKKESFLYYLAQSIYPPDIVACRNLSEMLNDTRNEQYVQVFITQTLEDKIVSHDDAERCYTKYLQGERNNKKVLFNTNTSTEGHLSLFSDDFIQFIHDLSTDERK